MLRSSKVFGDYQHKPKHHRGRSSARSDMVAGGEEKKSREEASSEGGRITPRKMDGDELLQGALSGSRIGRGGVRISPHVTPRDSGDLTLSASRTFSEDCTTATGSGSGSGGGRGPATQTVQVAIKELLVKGKKYTTSAKEISFLKAGHVERDEAKREGVAKNEERNLVREKENGLEKGQVKGKEETEDGEEKRGSGQCKENEGEKEGKSPAVHNDSAAKKGTEAVWEAKVVAATANEETKANQTDSFMRELYIMSGLAHPNIVKLYGICRQPHLQMVLEFCPG